MYLRVAQPAGRTRAARRPLRRVPRAHIERAIDARRVAPGLYQGSRPPSGPVLAALGVATVVLCAMEHQPDSREFGGIEVVHVPMDDDARPPSRTEWELARMASRVAAVRLLEGRRVLVTCYSGLNRSGLVSALTLLRVGPPGFSPSDAVRQVQMNRPGALRNPYMVDAILRTEKQRR